ncbi:hypothetical protein IGI04_005974 [Brassica rapa subsp. trilocularis]|uniref:Uncharacterized protein n=1 Tax=Brassica rapa subsp. trilocularis TaxID=1813537 RepID=A0ABQ7NFI4_BRACM|nr:hypothetical protein IGI04_005974 [Brassica rapa subsp. trilocularis]
MEPSSSPSGVLDMVWTSPEVMNGPGICQFCFACPSLSGQLLRYAIFGVRMVKAVQAVQIKHIMQIKQIKSRSSRSCGRNADQVDQRLDWSNQILNLNFILN